MQSSEQKSACSKQLSHKPDLLFCEFHTSMSSNLLSWLSHMQADDCTTLVLEANVFWCHCKNWVLVWLYQLNKPSHFIVLGKWCNHTTEKEYWWVLNTPFCSEWVGVKIKVFCTSGFNDCCSKQTLSECHHRSSNKPLFSLWFYINCYNAIKAKADWMLAKKFLSLWDVSNVMKAETWTAAQRESI